MHFLKICERRSWALGMKHKGLTTEGTGSPVYSTSSREEFARGEYLVYMHCTLRHPALAPGTRAGESTGHASGQTGAKHFELGKVAMTSSSEIPQTDPEGGRGAFRPANAAATRKQSDCIFSVTGSPFYFSPPSVTIFAPGPPLSPTVLYSSSIPPKAEIKGE